MASLAPVEFEWDGEKRRANLAKHGLDLADADALFAGPVFEAADDRRDYRERRIIAVGSIAGRLVACVYTDRVGANGGAVRRIISLRPASRKERANYVDHTRAPS